MLPRVKIFYGWFVIFGAFLICTATIGMHYSLIGLYYPSITERFAYSNTQLGLYFITFFSLTIVITSLCIAKIYSRISIRFGMGLGGILAGLSYIGFSFASSAIEFIIFSMILGFCIGVGTVSAFSILTTKWFIYKRGTAISIIAAGSGLAGVFFSGLISNIIENSGYQRAFFIEGIIIIALTCVGVFFIRSSPASMNLQPLTDPNKQEDANANTPNQAKELRSITMKEATKKYPFYVLSLALFVMNGTVVTFLSQYASYFKSLNFEASNIALIMTGLGASLTLNKIFYGILSDKFGLQKANCYLFFAWCATLCALLFAEVSSIVVFIFVFFSGNLAVVTTVATPLWVANMFGEEYYPTFIGTFTAFANIGTMVFPILIGHSIDTFGYKIVFIATLALVVVLCTLLFLAIRSAINTRKELPQA